MAKNNCADCIHKDVCALWEIQNGIGDAECVYYRPTPTQPNEPLTLDELQKMCDQPVYVVHTYGGKISGRWALVATQKWGAVSLIYTDGNETY